MTARACCCSLRSKATASLTRRACRRWLDLAKTAEEKQIVALAFSGVSVARPFVAPPGLPPERLAMLREALAATAQDPELLEDARRGGNNIRFTPAPRMEEIIAAAYATDPAVVAKVRGLMAE